MKPPRVLVLGGSGCLGTALVNEFKNQGNQVIATYRSPSEYESKNYIQFKVGDNIEALVSKAKADVIVNCIVAKPKSNYTKIISTLLTNSFFPKRLSKVADKKNIRLIHVSTDSVFLGIKGLYTEVSLPIPSNLYSASKLLGEPKNSNSRTIRLSFVPAKLKSAQASNSVLWLTQRNLNIPTYSYSNRLWNGLTDLIVAKLIVSTVNNKYLFESMPSKIHLYTKQIISQYDLAILLSRIYSLSASNIYPKSRLIKKDLSLSSRHFDFVEMLWKSIGFEKIPSIVDIID